MSVPCQSRRITKQPTSNKITQTTFYFLRVLESGNPWSRQRQDEFLQRSQACRWQPTVYGFFLSPLPLVALPLLGRWTTYLSLLPELHIFLINSSKTLCTNTTMPGVGQGSIPLKLMDARVFKAPSVVFWGGKQWTFKGQFMKIGVQYRKAFACLFLCGVLGVEFRALLLGKHPRPAASLRHKENTLIIGFQR